jgi:hypothetical protein
VTANPLSNRRLWLAAGLTLLAACGARSQLHPGDSGDGGGAVTGPGVGGDGAAGGNGGFGGQGGDGGEGGQGGTPFEDCTDPDVTYIYLVTQSLSMFAYKPLLGELEYRGLLDCNVPGAGPFSMAVSRAGRAYVLYNDGSLWEADVTDASCEATPYAIAQQGFLNFGMGYALDDDQMGETLYVSDIDYEADLSKGLGIIDTQSFELTTVGSFGMAPGFRIELTGEGTDLYAFIIDDQIGGGHLGLVDKESGQLGPTIQVPVGSNIGSWHFASWGSEFYFFTEVSGEGFTTIRRYDPVTQGLVELGTVPEPVVGAGASTCAPQ